MFGPGGADRGLAPRLEDEAALNRTRDPMHQADPDLGLRISRQRVGDRLQKLAPLTEGDRLGHPGHDLQFRVGQGVRLSVIPTPRRPRPRRAPGRKPVAICNKLGESPRPGP
jgi:hypothetical protein